LGASAYILYAELLGKGRLKLALWERWGSAIIGESQERRE
jgi:hypothetical protein